MARTTKLAFQRLRERQHYRYDMNFDSSELCSTLYLRRRDVQPGQLYEEAQRRATHSVWDAPLRLRSIHKLNQGEETHADNDTTDRKENDDAGVTAVDEGTGAAQNDPTAATAEPNRGSFTDRYRHIRQMRSVSQNAAPHASQTHRVTHDAENDAHKAAVTTGSVTLDRILQQTRWETQQGANHDHFDARSRTLKQLPVPSPEREITHKKEIYVDALLPNSLTSYGTFYRPPPPQQPPVVLTARQSLGANGADRDNNDVLNMQPGFYKSCVPKYLNLRYKNALQTYERARFMYQAPACVRPREYNPSPDGVHRKRHLLTNEKWHRVQRSHKTYY